MKDLVEILLWALFVPVLVLVMSFINWSNQFKLLGTALILRLVVLYIVVGVIVTAADHLS